MAFKYNQLERKMKMPQQFENEYRVVNQHIRLNGSVNTVSIYSLQQKTVDGEWYTWCASSWMADIKHACQEGRNTEQKMQAYNNFRYED